MKVKTNAKRKRSQTRQPAKRKVVDFVSQDDDNDDDDDDVSFASSNDDRNDANGSSDETEEEKEPLQVKQVRLAREYLETINAAVSDSESSSDDEQDPISRRLQKQRQLQEGTYQRKIAASIETLLTASTNDIMGLSTVTEATTPRQLQQLYMQTRDTDGTTSTTPSIIRYLQPFQTHHMTPTCVAVNPSTHQAVSGSKDHSVVLWDVQTEQRLQFLAPRYTATNGSSSSRTTGHIWSVAFDKETQMVAAGARDGTVRLYDVRQQGGSAGAGPVHTFSHAKSGITALRFDNNSSNNSTLYTASMDRCIRVYEERLLVETLYGHQAPVHDLTVARSKYYPISVGADRTARIWKRDTDSHLIVRCPTVAADCVASVPAPNDNNDADAYFVTGHADGSLQTWQTRRKQAIHIRPRVHTGNGGIHSLTSLHDVVVSGGNDGWMQFYQAGVVVQPAPEAPVVAEAAAAPTNKAERRKKKTSSQNLLRSIGRLPIHGCINDLCMTATYVLAAVGQEPKWGRWERTAGAKNRILLVPLATPGSSSNASSDETTSDEE